MATDHPHKDIAWSALNKIELATIELLLYKQADLINALMRDGIPYTKLLLPTKMEVP